MKFCFNLLTLFALSFSMIACNADSNKNDSSKSNSSKVIPKDLLSSLYSHEYSSEEFRNEQVESASGLYFENKGKFHINSYHMFKVNEESTPNICDIEGDMQQLSNELLLLTQVEGTSEGEKMNIVMTIKLIDDKNLELDLIYPSHLRDFCGVNADLSIIGKYTKTK